jgi:alpha-beta hydrolase superfamily lysophospholipase
MTTTTSSVPSASTDPVALSFDVTLETLGTARIAAWAFPPQYPSDLMPAIWLIGFPGATYRGLAYNDQQVPGFASHAYSMARTCARHGIGFVAIDHLGTGASRTDILSDQLTFSVLIEAYPQLVQQMRQRLTHGTLVAGLAALAEELLWLAGVGHSMGSVILTYLQGQHHPFDAVVLLGLPYQPANVAAFFSAFGQAALEKFQQDAGNPQEIRALRMLSRPMFYSADVPPALIEADEQDATVVPLGLARELLNAEKAVEWAARIRTPIYLGLGELEVPAPLTEPATYRSSHAITVFVQPGAAHCANFAQSRLLLWTDVIAWYRARSALSHKLRLDHSW